MEKVFNVNYTIPKNMMRAVLPHMRTNKNGTVINITSIAGIQPKSQSFYIFGSKSSARRAHTNIEI